MGQEAQAAPGRPWGFREQATCHLPPATLLPQQIAAWGWELQPGGPSDGGTEDSWHLGGVEGGEKAGLPGPAPAQASRAVLTLPDPLDPPGAPPPPPPLPGSAPVWPPARRAVLRWGRLESADAAKGLIRRFPSTQQMAPIISVNISFNE